MSQKKKKIEVTSLPKYLPGTIIVGDGVCGKIETAFYNDGQWNYCIAGKTAVDLDKIRPDPEEPTHLRMGYRYVREDQVRHYHDIVDGWKKQRATK